MTMSRVGRWIRAATIALPLLLATSLSIRPATAAAGSGQAPAKASSLPGRLSDAEFWKLVSDISEPGGYFRISDNYTSNEREVGQLFTMLREGGVLGG
ncbi:MAG TPA: hypothetical protein VNU19_11595, partial [Candidatus Acidoferrum sp.]|nr:hypothetical protein [Candidatus Acidoferrum sp.]